MSSKRNIRARGSLGVLGINAQCPRYRARGRTTSATIPERWAGRFLRPPNQFFRMKRPLWCSLGRESSVNRRNRGTSPVFISSGCLPGGSEVTRSWRHWKAVGSWRLTSSAANGPHGHDGSADGRRGAGAVLVDPLGQRHDDSLWPAYVGHTPRTLILADAPYKPVAVHE